MLCKYPGNTLGYFVLIVPFRHQYQGAKYGILAGISSFIFQLPFQLFFLECHRLEEETLELKETEVDPEAALSPQKVAPVNESSDNQPKESHPSLGKAEQDEAHIDIEPKVSTGMESSRLNIWAKFLMRGDIWLKILKKVFHNPVLWAIAGGFFLTLSTIGPTYLNDKSEDFVPGLKWISDTLFFIGNTVTPLSLFTMGIWMASQGRKMFQMNPFSALACMVSKLILVPLIMLGLTKALGLEDEPGRAAVLIAALPISMASFSLANRYEIGEAVMAENVALGTLLVLPTVIVWNLVLDEAGLFPIP